MRPHHHRAAAGRGLDQVLTAQRREAAAQQRHASRGVEGRHLAQRVAQPHLGCGVGALLIPVDPVETNYQKFITAIRSGYGQEPSFRHAANLQKILDLAMLTEVERRELVV